MVKEVGCTCKPNDPCYYHKGELLKETDREFLNSPYQQSVSKQITDAARSGFEAGRATRPLKNTGYYDLDLFLDDCFKTMREKGHDYRQGNDKDLLHNFRTVAQTVNSSMEKVWFTYFYKHYSAMCTYIKEGGQSESEPIEGRIKDQIVYLILFYRMVTDAKRVKAGDTFPVSVKFPELNDPNRPPMFNKEENENKITSTLNEILDDLRKMKEEEPLPLMAEKLEVVEKGSLDEVKLPIGETPPVGTVRVDPVRAQELAGLRKGPAWKNNVTGEHMEHGDVMVPDNLPPALVENIKHTQEVLNERDQEAADRANGKGFGYKAPGVDEFDKLPCGCEVAVGVYDCVKHPDIKLWDPSKYPHEKLHKQLDVTDDHS